MSVASTAPVVWVRPDILMVSRFDRSRHLSPRAKSVLPSVTTSRPPTVNRTDGQDPLSPETVPDNDTGAGGGGGGGGSVGGGSVGGGLVGGGLVGGGVVGGGVVGGVVTPAA